MRPLRRHEGVLVPLDRADVDTDQIIPKQFLKRIERSGFGPFLFYDWKRSDPDFVLNRPEHAGASVLVAGPNFGCGSSREHAPWSIQDAGFRAVIAPSFGDIFRNNCLKIGLLPVVLPEDEVRALGNAGQATIDLERQVVTFGDRDVGFEIDPDIRHRLLGGLDDIAVTLQRVEQIDRYERERERPGPVTTAL